MVTGIGRGLGIGTTIDGTETLASAFGGVLGAETGTKGRELLDEELAILSSGLKCGNSSSVALTTTKPDGSPPEALAASSCFATNASARACCFFAFYHLELVSNLAPTS